MPSYYIAPNTTIILCKGVPLDAQYEHTLFFNPFNDAQKAVQYSVLSSYAKYTFTAQYYQRHEKDKLRVQVTCDNVLDCNYMIFQNTAFGSKYFYAFITHVAYINNNTTEITYEIDVMQTFNFDYALGDCFVEREHVTDDVFGHNLVDEGLATGDYVVNTSQSKTYPLSGIYNSIAMYARIKYIPNEKCLDHCFFPLNSLETSIGTSTFTSGKCGIMTCGQVEPSAFVVIPVVNGNEWTPRFLNALINVLLSISATIVSIDAIPANIAEGTTGYGINTDYVNGQTPMPPQTPPTVTLSINEGAEFKDIDLAVGANYTPNNNKLYTSPYRKLILSNHNGKNNELKWELFKDRSQSGRPSVTFPVQSYIIPKAAAYCYPQQYRGIADDYDNGVSLDNFAEYMWSEDTYTKWLAQNTDANRQKVANSIISGALRGLTTVAVAGLTVASGGSALPMVAATGAVAGSAVSSINTVLSNITADKSAEASPDPVCGSSERNDIPLANGALGFTVYDMNIRPEYAKRIDHFFDLYGYKVNELKIPNVRDSSKIAGLRRVWNYVKTGNINIHPAANSTPSTNIGLTQAVENKIADIYQKGITFWMNYSGYHVGDYASYAQANRALTR